jgi:hypothetical protein
MGGLSASQRTTLYRNARDGEFDEYILEAERLAFVLLPYIHRGVPDHTGHGVDHSIAVLGYVNEFIDLLKSIGNPLNATEIKLLYISSWLHDIGNITRGSRTKGHSIESCRLLVKLKDTNRYNIGNLYLLLDPIIRFHSSSFDISTIDDSKYSFEGEKVRMKLLCSIFRLSDTCDISERRANNLVYSLIGDEFEEEVSKEHWKSNAAVMSVILDLPSKEIQIYVTNAKDAKLATDHLGEEFASVLPYISPYLPFQKVVIIEVPEGERTE